MEQKQPEEQPNPNRLHPNRVFHPGIRMSYEFQRQLASRQLPYKDKCHVRIKNFSGMLNRCIRHPDKLNLYLSKSYCGRPLTGRGPFQDMYTPVFEPVLPGRSYSHYSFFGSRSTGINPPTPIPSEPTFTKMPRPMRADDKSHLALAITAAQLSFQPLKLVDELLSCFTKRAYKKSQELSITDPHSGLPQLAGFCFQLLKIMGEATKSSNCIQSTAFVGLKVASEFLQDPHGLYYLIKGFIPKYEARTTEDNVTAKIKMHIAQDETMAAYQRMGRSGFEGNWASFKGQNPDIINSDEMQLLIFALMNAFSVLTTWAESMVELFDVLVFSDDIEKTYVLAHLRSMRIQDHIDIIIKIDELRKLTNQVNRLLTKIYQAADWIIFIVCPPRRPDEIRSLSMKPVISPNLWEIGDGDRMAKYEVRRGVGLSSYKTKYCPPNEIAAEETKDKKKIPKKGKGKKKNIDEMIKYITRNGKEDLAGQFSPEKSTDCRKVKGYLKKIMDEMNIALKKLEHAKLALNDLSGSGDQTDYESDRSKSGSPDPRVSTLYTPTVERPFTAFY